MCGLPTVELVHYKAGCMRREREAGRGGWPCDKQRGGKRRLGADLHWQAFLEFRAAWFGLVYKAAANAKRQARSQSFSIVRSFCAGSQSAHSLT